MLSGILHPQENIERSLKTFLEIILVRLLDWNLSLSFFLQRINRRNRFSHFLYNKTVTISPERKGGHKQPVWCVMRARARLAVGKAAPDEEQVSRRCVRGEWGLYFTCKERPLGSSGIVSLRNSHSGSLVFRWSRRDVNASSRTFAARLQRREALEWK